MKNSDITAAVLTIGEDTYKRAILSLEKQSVKPREIITIRNVSPFYKALNQGASLVKTKFFIQVDSDMILDEDCLQNLRNCFEPKIGIVIGQLRDRLIEMETGIKMFRTECFEKSELRDSIAPDTDFYNDIKKYGWNTRRVLNLSTIPKNYSCWHTFGEHRPDYNTKYTYYKYYVLGIRHRYWNHLIGIKYLLDKLGKNKQDISYIAQTALVNGFFNIERKDMLSPSSFNTIKGYNHIKEFLRNNHNNNNMEFHNDLLNSKKLFDIYVKLQKLGQDIISYSTFENLKICVDGINKDDSIGWFATIAFLSGISKKISNSVTSIQDDYNFIVKNIRSIDHSIIVEH